MAEQIIIVPIECPKCGANFKRKVRITHPEIKVRNVECLKCGHKWTYRGFLRSRIRCPMCGSSKNEVNRKHFGRFKPKG